MSLSFVLTVSVPAVASTDVTSPVMRVGFACAKLSPLKARVVKATIKTLIVFFTVSPPFSDLDVWIYKCFKSPQKVLVKFDLTSFYLEHIQE
jgi:hypothetical protein